MGLVLAARSARTAGAETEVIVQGAPHAPADNPRGADNLFDDGGLVFMTQTGPGTADSAPYGFTSHIAYRVIPDPGVEPMDDSHHFRWEKVRNGPHDHSFHW